jgi:hypothetical protein
LAEDRTIEVDIDLRWIVPRDPDIDGLPTPGSKERIIIQASSNSDCAISTHCRAFHRKQIPECWNNKRWIAIVALEVAVGKVGIIAGFARAISVALLKVVIEDSLEPFSRDRAPGKRARPSA